MNPQEFIKQHLHEIQKPSRYTGGEYGSIYKDKKEIKIRYAFCFPDMYDIGMSHLGIKILYHLINSRNDSWCERVFAPNDDMEKLMRKYSIPLYALESKDPIRDFNFIGFTLQYELCYTNILNMLNLANIPLFSKDRDDSFPIIMCGGPCACNPAPLSDFVDLFFIGDGEEYFPKLLDLYLKYKCNKTEFLKHAESLECMYVPMYHNNNKKVKRAVVKDIDNMFYPSEMIVPYSEVVHDRVMLEVMRGCIRGCRFCQAGIIYRPYRQKSPDKLYDCAVQLCNNTGYDEISLTSLSTSDYEKLPELCDKLIDFCKPRNINISLPSLRVDNFTKEILEKLQSVRRSGLTFAPEAGTQRLRDVINKNVTDDEIMNTSRIAFEGGTSNVKLYFMMGLPTETDEDLEGIVKTAQKIEELYYSINGKKARWLSITISLATFVPKPFTPFQWEPQISLDEINRKQHFILSCPHDKHIEINYNNSFTSQLEGAMSRGDKKIGQVIYNAWKLGCKFDAWDEYFDFSKWLKAFELADVSISDYANRRREFDEILPWDIINIGVTKKFLQNECDKAYRGITTKNCKQQCSGCGMSDMCKGDVCP